MEATGPRCFAPSDHLTAIFRECSRDPTDVIRTRLRSMLNRFLQHQKNIAGNEGTNGKLYSIIQKQLGDTSDLAVLQFKPQHVKMEVIKDRQKQGVNTGSVRENKLSDHRREEPSELAGRCCRQAGIGYYWILEKHAIQERNRLGITDLSCILNNELYQCCLVVCCLEMAIKSNNLRSDFPLLLEINNLAPYHFGKVIELVLRLRQGLSRTVFRHLAQLEEKILESMAWTSDSPLWRDIRANDGRLPICQQFEDLSRTVLQADGNLPGVPANHVEQPAAQNRPPISFSLSVFARKVYMLMNLRLRDLCSKLAIPDGLCSKIWTCFEHSLVHFPDLMLDRHLDQLLMCAIYIIAKITNMDLTFRRIAACYMSLPLASRSVYRNVLISRRNTENYPTGKNNNSVSALTPDTPSSHNPSPRQEERGNLINFYNHVYRTKMANFVQQFAPPSVGTPPVTSYEQQYRITPHRYRLSSSHHIYISLYNREWAPQQASGLSYYFNSSNSERLHQINNMVSGRIPSRRSHVAISMNGVEEEEEGDDGPPLRRLRLDRQSAFHRRLRDVVNDRVAGRDQGQPPAGSQPNLH